MQCKLCRKVVRKKRTFNNLFDFEISDVCINCFKSYMNYYPYFVIPIYKGQLHIFELLHKPTNHPQYFINYFRPYYQAYFKTDMTIDAIYIEVLTTKIIELFDVMELGHLIIFTNNFKEE